MLSNILNFLNFPNVEICESILNNESRFSCMIRNMLVINKGSKGPDLVEVLEVP